MGVLVKFGEKDHLKQLMQGEMFFSPSIAFKKIEELECNKGQGDRDEGVTEYHAKNVKMVPKSLDGSYDMSKTIFMKDSIFNFMAEPCRYFPIFCLSNFEKNSNRYSVDLDQIKKDFPKSTYALIICSKENFVNQIQSKFDAFCHDVLYFKKEILYEEFLNFFSYGKSDGFDDTNYNIMTDKGLAITDVNVFKDLFKKDTYFTKQKEYRILLKNIRIQEPKIYNIGKIDNCKLVEIDKLENELNNI